MSICMLKCDGCVIAFCNTLSCYQSDIEIAINFPKNRIKIRDILRERKNL